MRASLRRLVGKLPIKTDPYVEQWGYMREHLEYQFNFTPGNVVASFVMLIGIPMGLHRMVKGEFVRTVDSNPVLSFLGTLRGGAFVSTLLQRSPITAPMLYKPDRAVLPFCSTARLLLWEMSIRGDNRGGNMVAKYQV